MLTSLEGGTTIGSVAVSLGNHIIKPSSVSLTPSLALYVRDGWSPRDGMVTQIPMKCRRKDGDER